MAQKSSFTCVHCKKSFSTKTRLGRHIRIHTGEKPFQCSYCEKSFSRKDQRKEHERIHTGAKPFSCKYCEKSFSLKGNLVIHERLHTGKKPFQCEFCEKSFNEKANLKSHERIHTGEKPFKCTHCKKSFAQKHQRVLHIRIHTGEKPFRCKYCEKSFAHTANLVTHERVHTGEKPFKCKFCEKSFTQKGHHKRHELVHTGENSSSDKAFRCKHCKKSFSRKFNLLAHERIHTGKAIRCVQCEKTFATKQNLARHDIRIHSGKKPIRSVQGKKSYTGTSKENLVIAESESFQLNFICKYCQETFETEADFQEHELAHNDNNPKSLNVSAAILGRNKQFKSTGYQAMKRSRARPRPEKVNEPEGPELDLTGHSNTDAINSLNGQNPKLVVPASECLITRKVERRLPAAAGRSELDIEDATMKMTCINRSETEVDLCTEKLMGCEDLSKGVKLRLIQQTAISHCQQTNVKSEHGDVFVSDQSDVKVGPVDASYMMSDSGQSMAEQGLHLVHDQSDVKVEPIDTCDRAEQGLHVVHDQSDVKGEPIDTCDRAEQGLHVVHLTGKGNVRSESGNQPSLEPRYYKRMFTSNLEHANVKSEPCYMFPVAEGMIISGPCDMSSVEQTNIKSEPGNVSPGHVGQGNIHVGRPCDVSSVEQTNIKSEPDDHLFQQSDIAPISGSCETSPIGRTCVKSEPCDMSPNEQVNIKSEPFSMSWLEQANVLSEPCNMHVSPIEKAKNVKSEPFYTSPIHVEMASVRSEPRDISTKQLDCIENDKCDISPIEEVKVKTESCDDISPAGHPPVQVENCNGAECDMSKIKECIVVLDRWAEMLGVEED